MDKAGDNTIVFTNFVDFDSYSSYSHRRDVAGYAAALELFDRRLPELFKWVNGDDIIIIFTALPLYRFTALPLYRFTALPLYRFTALPLYRFTALPLTTAATRPGVALTTPVNTFRC